MKVSKGGLPDKLDLLFLMDGSMSVKSGPFAQGLGFVNKIVGKMHISASHGRVGFVQFAHKVREGVIGLKQSTQMGKSSLMSTVKNTPYLSGGTEIGRALQEAIAMFKHDGRSDGAEKYIMVLSDGGSKTASLITAAMKQISALKIKTFAVAIGSAAKLPESRRQLLQIAQGKANHLFEVDNYNQLNEELLKKILVAQCD